MMSPMSAEAAVVRNYIDWILSLPWFETFGDKIDLSAASEVLDADHYGLEKPKELSPFLVCKCSTVVFMT